MGNLGKRIPRKAGWHYGVIAASGRKVATWTPSDSPSSLKEDGLWWDVDVRMLQPFNVPAPELTEQTLEYYLMQHAALSAGRRI